MDHVQNQYYIVDLLYNELPFHTLSGASYINKWKTNLNDKTIYATFIEVLFVLHDLRLSWRSSKFLKLGLEHGP